MSTASAIYGVKTEHERLYRVNPMKNLSCHSDLVEFVTSLLLLFSLDSVRYMELVMSKMQQSRGRRISFCLLRLDSHHYQPNAIGLTSAPSQERNVSLNFLPAVTFHSLSLSVRLLRPLHMK
jgi:hypothetical protein